jgi:hypothetical protein
MQKVTQNEKLPFRCVSQQKPEATATGKKIINGTRLMCGTNEKVDEIN